MNANMRLPYTTNLSDMVAPETFQQDFEGMSDMLRRFALKLTGNWEDAQDLFQETAFRVLKNRDKFKKNTNFRSWCFTIMQNVFINRYRKESRRQKYLNSIIDKSSTVVNTGKETVRNAAESNIMMQELNRMVDGLSAELRHPFLRHYQGFKYQEIADEMHLPLGTIKSRIFMARKQLKAAFHKRYQELS